MCDSFLVVWYYLNSGYAHGQTFVQVQINIALFLERKYCNYFVIESYVVNSYIYNNLLRSVSWKNAIKPRALFNEINTFLCYSIKKECNKSKWENQPLSSFFCLAYKKIVSQT